MASINCCFFIGRLTADPELKTTTNGNNVTSFSIAVDRKVKQDEERKADFINIVAWRKTAEFVTKYFRKGNAIFVRGELQNRSYEKDGKKYTVSEIVADEVGFVESKPKTEASEAPAAPQYNAPSAGFAEVNPDDELPF